MSPICRLSFVLILAVISISSASARDSGNHKEVQLLQASYGNGINDSFGFGVDLRPVLNLNLAQCPIILDLSDKGSNYGRAKRDCKAALQEAAFQDSLNGIATPVLNAFEVPTYWYAGAPDRVMSENFGCSTVELRTVTPKSVAESVTFDGIGFFFNGAKVFFPKAQLDWVSEVALKDGQPALVHRFLGTDLCKRTGGSHYAAQITTFNVFARFGADDYWELENSNHEIGFANGNTTADGSGAGNTVPLRPQAIDRQDELLKK